MTVLSLPQLFAPSHLQYDVHNSLDEWQLHRFVEHGFSDLQLHATTSNKATGAILVGVRMWLSSTFQPKSEKSTAGRSLCSATHYIRTWVCFICCTAASWFGDWLLIFGVFSFAEDLISKIVDICFGIPTVKTNEKIDANSHNIIYIFMRIPHHSMPQISLEKQVNRRDCAFTKRVRYFVTSRWGMHV